MDVHAFKKWLARRRAAYRRTANTSRKIRTKERNFGRLSLIEEIEIYLEMNSESKSRASSTLRAMTLQYQPELTHSVWVDTYLSDEDECRLPRDELVERLKQGIRDGEWGAWRLVQIEQEVMGNVD